MRKPCHPAAIAAAITLLAGCATTPTPTAQTTPGKLLTNTFATAKPGTGRILVKRDSVLFRMGNGCAHRIYLDGKPVAELYIAEAVSMFVPPGEHIVGAELTSICSGTSETLVVVHAGETKTLRTSANGDGNIVVQPTAF